MSHRYNDSDIKPILEWLEPFMSQLCSPSLLEQNFRSNSAAQSLASRIHFLRKIRDESVKQNRVSSGETPICIFDEPNVSYHVVKLLNASNETELNLTAQILEEKFKDDYKYNLIWGGVNPEAMEGYSIPYYRLCYLWRKMELAATKSEVTQYLLHTNPVVRRLAKKVTRQF